MSLEPLATLIIYDNVKQNIIKQVQPSCTTAWLYDLGLTAHCSGLHFLVCKMGATTVSASSGGECADKMMTLGARRLAGTGTPEKIPLKQH